MSNDVKRAYFFAPTKRPIFIEIPAEDWEVGDEHRVGQLNLSLYGTRDAAANWAAAYTKMLQDIGFVKGRSSPCNFYHPDKQIKTTVHGDDFTSSGPEEELLWLKAKMEEKFDIKTNFLGPDVKRHAQEIRILNRVLRWTSDGIEYEADPRHAEIVVEQLGLVGAKPVVTPGCREEAAEATRDDGEPEDDSDNLLVGIEATMYRGIVARLNYLALDRPDIQYACKEVSRKMSSPREQDWTQVKRIGRYLIGAPRLTQSLCLQSNRNHFDTFTDSDWAGCKKTCRSTSGGAATIGRHTIKTWSTTQATVALSSGEAELFSLVKGACISLGLISLANDFGIDLGATLHTDASAAVGMVGRQGLGKLRHLNVQYLWIQDRIKSEELKVLKVPGTDNPADLFTKHLSRELMKNIFSS